MAGRNWIIAAGLAVICAPLAAQDGLSQPGEIIEIPLAPLQPNPCNAQVRCPDPLTLDTAELPMASNIRAPDAAPVGLRTIKPVKSRRVLVFFQNGHLVQLLRYARIPQTRAGGHTFVASPGDAPWMAQIERPLFVRAATARALTWEDRQFCGGSLVAPGWIVTAAHCLNDYGKDIKSAGYRVRLGLSDIRTGLGGISYAIDRIVEHPDYPKSRDYYNDIALIHFAADERTRADAQGTRRRIAAIAIDPYKPGAQPLGGKEAWFYGWGTTDSQHPSAPLMYGKIKLESDRSCAHNGIALCGRGVGTRGSTQCHGDSGGPLIRHDDTVPLLIGLVSHNAGRQTCGVNEKQGVYTRLAGYRAWIEGYTGPLRRPARPVQRQPGTN